MSGFRQGSVSGFSEVFSPFKINDFRGKPPDALHRSIGASGVRDDDFINHGSDTLQGALDPILFILNDHAQRNRHTRKGTKQVSCHFPDRQFLTGQLLPNVEKGVPR